MLRRKNGIQQDQAVIDKNISEVAYEKDKTLYGLKRTIKNLAC